MSDIKILRRKKNKRSVNMVVNDIKKDYSVSKAKVIRVSK